MLDQCLKVIISASDGYEDGEDYFFINFIDPAPFLS